MTARVGDGRVGDGAGRGRRRSGTAQVGDGASETARAETPGAKSTRGTLVKQRGRTTRANWPIPKEHPCPKS
jgi:hypothetical protein